MIEPNDYSNIQYLLGYINASVFMIPEKYQKPVFDALQQLDVFIDRYKPNTNQN